MKLSCPFHYTSTRADEKYHRPMGAKLGEFLTVPPLRAESLALFMIGRLDQDQTTPQSFQKAT